MSKVFPDKKFGLWKREGMENLSDKDKEDDDENEKNNEDGKSVNAATVVFVPKWPELRCISLFFFPQNPTLNTRAHSLRIHCLSICTRIKRDIP